MFRPLSLSLREFIKQKKPFECPVLRSASSLPISHDVSYEAKIILLGLTALHHGLPALRQNQSTDRLVGRRPEGSRNAYAQLKLRRAIFVPERLFL